jgi:hypothetical protein
MTNTRLLGLLVVFNIVLSVACIKGADAQDVVTGYGVVCDTPQQVERYISSSDTKATLAKINEEQPHSCELKDVAFYLGGIVKTISNEEGLWEITKILVVAVRTGMGVQEIHPSPEYTAFLKSKATPINITPENDQWEHSPYHQWYKAQELTPAAKQRFKIDKCCDNAEVVRTDFRVDRSGKQDQWWWLDGNEWRQIPDYIIHWGEHAPDKRPTLFIWNGKTTCFFPPEEGI